MDGKALKGLIEMCTTPDKIDEKLSKFTDFETPKEKIAFLKGMFYEDDIEIIDQKEDDSDELIYQLYLNAIVNKKFL